MSSNNMLARRVTPARATHLLNRSLDLVAQPVAIVLKAVVNSRHNHLWEIPSSKSQIPNPKSQIKIDGGWDLGFGIWIWDFPKHTPGTFTGLARRARPLARKRR
jgi:hypothetical protein